MPSLWLCLWPSPASGTLTSHALLAQTSVERMTSVGCRHPHRIYVFTRIFGQCKPIYICHSDPTNSQALLHVYLTDAFACHCSKSNKISCRYGSTEFVAVAKLHFFLGAGSPPREHFPEDVQSIAKCLSSLARPPTKSASRIFVE